MDGKEGARPESGAGIASTITRHRKSPRGHAPLDGSASQVQREVSHTRGPRLQQHYGLHGAEAVAGVLNGHAPPRPQRQGPRENGAAPVILRCEQNAMVYFAAKRALDIVLVVLAATLALPVLLVAVILVRLDSPGPAIFKQHRMAARRTKRDGSWVWEVRPFTCYKIRTMYANATSDLHREYIAAYISGDEESTAAHGNGSKPPDDPRVTRVGRVLRKLSIDELPQLWNVLKGDMSLVGPRPPIPYEVDVYEDRYLPRLASPAGMTGWWQVQGRSETTFEEMVRLDLEYISRRSLWFDLMILVLTIPAVLSRRGAG